MSRRHLNTEQRRELKAAELALFHQHAARKAQKGQDPNDRRSDPEFAKALRRMSPLDIYDLMSFDDDAPA